MKGYRDLLHSQAFEQFPREKLTFIVSRRRFWTALVDTALGFTGQGGGVPAFGLDELGCLPDDQIGAIVPRVVDGCQITVNGGWVWMLAPSKTTDVRVLPLTSPALTAFNQFNGCCTLADISTELVSQTDWTPDRAFAYVRGLFLTLVLLGICLPANNQTSG